ncbi:MAG: FAD-binding oxidoreductase [Gammaproteobacteria bacterium]
MNTRNNKTSLISRLFEQSGSPAVKAHGKIHYGHRHHDHLAHLRSPFSDLFYGAEKIQPDRPIPADDHRYSASRLSNNEPAIIQQLETIRQRTSNENIHPVGRSSLESQLTLVSLYDETPDTKTFRFADQTGWIFDYWPGQYLTLSLVIDGRDYKRSYSIASSPSRPGFVEITVKRVPNGVVSNWLSDNLQIGDEVTVKRPYGKFSCMPHIPKKILFLAAGSGVVPIISMLRWLTDTGVRADIQLLLSFRSPKDIIYRNELELMVARHSNVRMVITLTADQIAGHDWPGLTERINKQMLQQAIPDPADRTVFLCGPDAFMAGCKKDLLELNVPNKNLCCESFNVNNPAINSDHACASSGLRKSTGNYRVKFAKSGKTIASDGQLSLLELAEKAVVALDYECHHGDCGVRMIKCLKGKVEMTEQAEIGEIDRKKGWIYSCSAYPCSNVVLDL